MTLSLIVEIAQLALSIVNNAVSGKPDAPTTASALLQILQKGAQAYEQHTGEALNPALIQTETPVP